MKGGTDRDMENQDYDFDDFDSDVAEAAKAEIAQEDAVEEESEEVIEDAVEEEVVEPKAPVTQPKRQSAPVASPKRTNTVPKAPVVAPKRNPVQQAPKANRTEELPRFVAVQLPKEYGVYDTQLRNYYKKDADVDSLVLAMLADIKNDLEEIRKSL